MENTDTNFNQMKSDLETMEKKYNDVLGELDSLIHDIYEIALYERKEESSFEDKEDLAYYLSWNAKMIAKEVGLYPYNQELTRFPKNIRFPYSTMDTEVE